MLEYVIRSYWQHVLAPRMSEGFLQWNCCLCTWQWEGLCVQSHFWKDLEESQGANGMRPDVCCGGGKIETIIRNGMNRHTDGYDSLGRSQHSSEGKSSPTNLLQFSEEVAEQVDKIKPADIESIWTFKNVWQGPLPVFLKKYGHCVFIEGINKQSWIKRNGQEINMCDDKVCLWDQVIQDNNEEDLNVNVRWNISWYWVTGW